jgi:sulfite reductase alpha subunit-like flavoprotein
MAKLCKISVSCLCMSLCDVSSISKYKNVVIVTSTYGDGGPPENAENFCEYLEGDHPDDMWRGVRYAVLSLGSTLYSFPFEFGNFVSRRFLQFGAQQLLDDGKLDDQRYNENEGFNNWSSHLFETMTSSHTNDDGYGQEKSVMKQALLVGRNKMLGFGKFDFNLLNPPFEVGFSNDSLAMESRVKYADNVVIAVVGENESVSSDPTNQIFSINLKFPENSLHFQPGDNIAVLPTNDIDLVRRLITHLGYPGDLVFNVESTSLDGILDGDKLSCSLGENKCTLEIALSYYYDITEWLSKTLLQFFALNCVDEVDQETLFGYASNFQAFLKMEYTPLDILEMFPSIQICSTNTSDDGGLRNLAVFLGLLKPMRTRPYSISSSPLVSTSSVRLVYKVVEYAVNESGKVKHGLCSAWLKLRKSGDEVAISLSKTRFRLPANDDVPIIMVGAGTGISPYFGFLEHRLALAEKTAKKFGEAVLIHGCRSEADFPHREKVDDAIKGGVLTCLWPAYSRKEGASSTYVQHVIDRECTNLWKYINNESGVIYSCGDIKIGISVKEAFVQLAQKCGNLDESQAKAFVHKLSTTGRLWHDEWGTSLSAQP